MAATPSNATVEEYNRILGRLNEDFDLKLFQPDLDPSPSKLKAPHYAREDQLIAAICERIFALHSRRGARLSECLGLFRAKADRLFVQPCTETENCFVNNDTPPTKISVYECLLETLFATDEVLHPNRTKRPSDEPPLWLPKRTKNQANRDEVLQGRAVDSIPVRSIDRQPQSSASQSSSFLSGEAASTQPSIAPDEVFSFATQRNGSLLASRTTIADDYDEEEPEEWDLLSSQTRQALHESFSRLDASPAAHPPTLAPDLPASQQEERLDIPPHEHADDLADSSSASEAAFFDASADLGKDLNNEEHRTLEDRMKGVWRKSTCPGLREAPLAVLWEVARVATHCDVDLQDCKIEYQPTESWRDQKTMRSKLLSDPSFIGRGLPPASDETAWKAALSTFQKHSEAVFLSAELVYRVNSNRDGPLYDLRMHPLKLELGHRLGRRFGADRFLEVTIPSPTSKRDQPALVKRDGQASDKIIRWLTQSRHYFLGRIWAPFYTRRTKKETKDANFPEKNQTTYPERVCFFAIDGDHFRNPESPTENIPPLEEALTPERRTKLSLFGLLDWAIGLRDNLIEPVPKLFSRISLSLTRTWPTVELDPRQIRNVQQDIGTYEAMNDGVGRLSLSLARKVADRLNLPRTNVPSAFQGRFGSAKGMWIIDVRDTGDEVWIETYPSQRKWLCDFQDVHHRTFEVKTWPRELKSASLNQQFIPVLEAQCQHPIHMRQALAGHLIASLRAEIDELRAAVQNPIALRAWLRRQQGLDSRDSFHAYLPFVGGLPDWDVDTLAHAIDSGFDPGSLGFFSDKIYAMGRRTADLLKKKMNIKVPRSTYALIVADFESVLEEGEVHLSFSTRFEADEVSMDMDDQKVSSDVFSNTNLEGFDVLVARSPAHFPTDIQKVRVVSKQELRGLKDVIVFSTKGKSPLADMLSGGDYDGDTAWICWDRLIVDNFRNAANVHTCPNLLKKGYLKVQNPTFQSILEDRKTWDLASVEFVHQAFSFNMEQPLLGQCTKYKEAYCYKEWNEHCRTDSESAFRLSTLLGYLVDQAKQGIVFAKGDWDLFREQMMIGGERALLPEPAYMGETPPERPPHGHYHVLDYLKFQVGSQVIANALTELKEVTSRANTWDHDLTLMHNYYEEMAGRSETMRRIMRHLKAELDCVFKSWPQEMAKTKRQDSGSDFKMAVRQTHQRWVDIAPPTGGSSTDKVARLLQDGWSRDPQTSTWELLKASTTFMRYYKRNGAFVFRVAGRQLCLLKARARPNAADSSSVMVVPEMWSLLMPNTKRIKAIVAQDSAGWDGDSAAALDEVTEFGEDGMVLDT